MDPASADTHTAISCHREGGEAEVDASIARQRSFDRDLWVIEVEDRRGRHLLDQEGLS